MADLPDNIKAAIERNAPKIANALSAELLMRGVLDGNIILNNKGEATRVRMDTAILVAPSEAYLQMDKRHRVDKTKLAFTEQYQELIAKGGDVNAWLAKLEKTGKEMERITPAMLHDAKVFNAKQFRDPPTHFMLKPEERTGEQYQFGTQADQPLKVPDAVKGMWKEGSLTIPKITDTLLAANGLGKSYDVGGTAPLRAAADQSQGRVAAFA